MGKLYKQDFKDIANIIKDCRNNVFGFIDFEKLVDSLCKYFPTTNERFDEVSFKKAIYDER